jgi:GNAT superfamily N-acetyltransferase
LIQDSSYCKIAEYLGLKVSQEESPYIFESGGDAGAGGQYAAYLLARDKESRKGLGYIQYTIFEGEIQISMIEVAQEFRNQGVGQALIEEMIKRENINYEDIDFGMTTPSGTALREKMDKAHGEEKMAKLSDLSIAKVAANMGFIKDSQMVTDENGQVVYFDPNTMELNEDGNAVPKGTGAEQGQQEIQPEAPRTPPDEVPDIQPEVDTETEAGLPVMIPVESSNVSSFGYDDDKQILYVSFLSKNNGADRLYSYYDVEPDVYTAFMESSSKGDFVWKYLRNRYNYARL